jgi:hypothetical protein
MADVAETLRYEIRRLRDVVERQYLELAWQQSELRQRGGKAKLAVFGAGALAKTGLNGNAALLVPRRELPPQDVWPSRKAPPRALVPNSGFASYAADQDEVTAIGVSVCGLTEDVVEQVTAMVEERLRRLRNFRPVFLMDITRTEIFRRRGFSYEYVALCADREGKLAPVLAEFTAERVAFLKRKWALAGIINFGSRPLEVTGPVHSAGAGSQVAVNSAVDQVLSLSALDGGGKVLRFA